MTSYNICKNKLLSQINPKEIKQVLHDSNVDIDMEFIGFVEQYYHLSKIIPKHFTVIDLGCASGFQSYYFKDFKNYIGIDVSNSIRVKPPSNAIYYIRDIKSFIKENVKNMDLNTCFAICNFIPDKKAVKYARKVFTNIFVFYPAGGLEVLMKKNNE